MSSEDWPEVRLGDHVDLLTGFPFKSAEFTDNSQDVPLVRGDNVVQGCFRWDGVRRWPRGDIDAYTGYLLESGDVILAMDRPWIEAGLKYAVVTPQDRPCLLVQRVSRLRGINGLSTRFLRYVIGSPAFTGHVLAVQTGTAVPHISGRQIAEFRFTLPPLAEQERIAETLGALDEKIEMTRRLSHTLESIARATFSSWFVDFDQVHQKMERREVQLPPDLAELLPASFVESGLGPIPEGWTAGCLADVAFLNPESWSQRTKPEFIQYLDLSNAKWGRIESLSMYQRGDAPSRAQRVLKVGDTIVGTVRPGNGSYALIAEDGLTGSTGFAVLRPRERAYREIVYLAATASENIVSMAHLADGGAYPAIRPEAVASTALALPPPATAVAFSELTAPLLARIACDERGSRTAAALRDSLLVELLPDASRGRS